MVGGMQATTDIAPNSDGDFAFLYDLVNFNIVLKKYVFLPFSIISRFSQHQGQCEEAPGVFANFITLGSLLLVLVSLPLSLFFVVKVVQVDIGGTTTWNNPLQS